MKRREFIKTGLAAGAAVGLAPTLAESWIPVHTWEGYDFGSGPKVTDRLYQGPFGVYAPDNFHGGWCFQTTMPGKQQINCMGMGMTTYISGDLGAPVVPGESLETTIDKLFKFQLGTKVYIRPNWRHIQKQAGKLDFDDYWKITMDKSLEYGKRATIRVMLNNPDIHENALPDYVLEKVPLRTLPGVWMNETPNDPRWGQDHRQPEYNDYLIGYFEEMQNLLAEKYNGGPEIELVDTQHFGLWGEGHAWPYEGHTFPTRKDAEDVMMKLYEIQEKAWTKVPLCTNVQPDFSVVGNSAVLDRSVRDGNWLRRDSILVQNECIEEMSNRPAWIALFCEAAASGNFTSGADNDIRYDRGEVTISHTKDMGCNYYSLWHAHGINADKLQDFYDHKPDVLNDLSEHIGFRVRPSWIWLSGDGEGHENLIFGMVNDGIAGVPGVLRLTVFSEDGTVNVGGCIDAGYPHPKGIREAMITLPKGVSAARGGLKLKMELEVKGVRYPIPVASDDANPDGTLTIHNNNRG
ncbi:MAG: twin-arginine translocation signal domain-containing protein [Bacteroidales bacterium]|nr:twin-arginine translocation signal domain-containing protein [Bacteroidales bacterium]